MVYGERRNEGRNSPARGIWIDPFVSEFDMGLVQPLSRSVRLNGFSTCLRLEQVYWDILAKMAKDQLLLGQRAAVPPGSRGAFAPWWGEELQRAGAGGLCRAQSQGRGLNGHGFAVVLKKAECRSVQSYGCTGRI
jgi:hypothetical protein